MIKPFKIRQSKIDLNSTAGNHLCGTVLGNLPKLHLPENFQPRRSDAIADRNILVTQIGLCCNAQNRSRNLLDQSLLPRRNRRRPLPRPRHQRTVSFRTQKRPQCRAPALRKIMRQPHHPALCHGFLQPAAHPRAGGSPSQTPRPEKDKSATLAHKDRPAEPRLLRLPDRSARRRNHPRLRTPQPLVQDHRANRPNVRITKPPSYPGKPHRGGSGLPSRKEISGVRQAKLS